MQGMSHLDIVLKDHLVLLTGVMQYCQTLQQGQAAMIQNQHVIIENQRILLQEVLALHTTSDSILMVGYLAQSLWCPNNALLCDSLIMQMQT